MIKGFNAKYTDVKLQYSTPSKYLDAISSGDNANIAWPTKYDDMFPYADDELSYWTGYFTSRANAKGYIRRGSAVLQSANKFFGADIIDTTKDQSRYLNILAAEDEAMDHLGILQHHDAVTGTGKQAVAENYNSKIYKGILATNNVFVESLDDFIK